MAQSWSFRLVVTLPIKNDAMQNEIEMRRGRERGRGRVWVWVWEGSDARKGSSNPICCQICSPSHLSECFWPIRPLLSCLDETGRRVIDAPAIVSVVIVISRNFLVKLDGKLFGSDGMEQTITWSDGQYWKSGKVVGLRRETLFHASSHLLALFQTDSVSKSSSNQCFYPGGMKSS